MNKVFLVGRLGNLPDEITGGCKLSIATKDHNGTEPITTWHRVLVFGDQAQLCSQYLQKGGLVGIDGRLSNKKQEDGSIRTSIIATRVEFISKVKEEE